MSIFIIASNRSRSRARRRGRSSWCRVRVSRRYTSSNSNIHDGSRVVAVGVVASRVVAVAVVLVVLVVVAWAGNERWARVYD